MSDRAVVLSVHPRHADNIFSGAKTAELRRVQPREIGQGSLVLLYVSSPIRSLVGALEVTAVVRRPLEILWNEVHDRAGIDHDEFLAYFQGLDEGTAILFDRAWQLEAPIELDEMRDGLGIHPPQSFRYLAEEALNSPPFAAIRELAVEHGATYPRQPSLIPPETLIERS